MKSFRFILILLSLQALVGASPRTALAESLAFWGDVQELLSSCAVQPFIIDETGERTYGAIRSTCPELELTSDGARLRVNGRTYFAHLLESEDSDGGDLAHLLITDRRGRPVAQLENVLAFGDVLYALVGRSISVREEQVSSLR